MSSVPAAVPPTTAPESAPTRIGPVLVAFAIGTLAAVALGVYGRLHTPTGQAVNLAGFSSGLAVKSFLATIAMILAVVQTVTAMALFGRIPLTGAWVGPVHRWSGRVAVAVTVPAAVHCLYALGFQTYDTRTLVHSLFGCFFYGAFVVKMLVLTRDDSPKWALPLMGGLVLSGLTALWMTAALWFYLNS
jgi:Family of unknown function (DUF6529)